ncbi:DUF3048 domain-containing protein [Bacillus pinisoli]|uniref:DUF3048 domain-containing protein n=1 Tax=Bacillus pinisoli TaxID=2901866 RepID=UPI001FF57797|nr:DUF3048 domain-containing protein [Bacillus pinisoli]
MNRIIFLISVVFVLLISVGCTKEEAEPVSGETDVIEESVENEVEEEVEEAPANTYPLTGIGTDDLVDQRTVAVMVNNDPKARPQSGLHKADIVFEVLAEGNITRFLAIFQSETPEKIGPVRSARDYYIELSKGYDAFYVAHGYSPDAEQMLRAGEVDSINGMAYDGILFKRAKFRKAPHNSYITFENIMKGATENNYATTHDIKPLLFKDANELDSISGEAAEAVKVAYSKANFTIVDYKYDTEKQKYYRYAGNELTEDLDSKEPVLLDNIFVVETTHQVLDSAGRREVDLTSGGDAYLIQRGTLQEVQWKNVDGRILPYLQNEPVEFVPGKTWVNIVETLEDVTFSGATN